MRNLGALVLAACLSSCSSLAAPESNVSGEVLVGGDLLYYEMFGTGEVPVVLIHGGGVDQRIWNPLTLALEEDYRVVRYDRRGYGRSGGPTTTYSEVQDLRSLIEWTRLGPVHLVGSRSGAAVALDFALEYPSAVRSLTLIAASGIGGHRYSGHETAGIEAVFKAARSRGAEAGIALWLDRPGMFAEGDREVEARAEMRLLLEENSQVFQFPSQLRRSSNKTKQQLPEVRVPTLVVWGAADSPDQRGVAKLLVEGIPGARPHRFETAGRMVVLELPDRLASVVRDFLAAAGRRELLGDG